LKADDGEFLDRYGRFCAGSLQSAALRRWDVLLPISIAFADECYAFRKFIVPHLVGNEFNFKGRGRVRDNQADYLSKAIFRKLG
jgi:hypothetical protein